MARLFQRRFLPITGLIVLVPTLLSGADDSPSDATRPANEAPPAGHSYHGDAFDEGPRQAARKIAGMGNVSFPVTSKVGEVQGWIDQGVGQLHGFWYFEAERSFRQAATLDPDCAMAYWGMSLANINNEKRAKEFIAKAVERKEKASPRERKYIEALNVWHAAEVKGDDQKKKDRATKYIKALEAIALEFPDDLEAKAFLTLQLWQSRGDVPIASHLAVSALIDEVLAVNPLHPVHHYKIHLWDYEKAERALASAALCGQSAPGIAHMWHMPGHIYSRVKRYEDAIWQQEASARVDHAYMMRDGILPDQIHNFAHNNEWLVRNLQFLGRAEEAIRLSKNTIDLPRHPKYNALPGKGSAHYGRLRLFETYSQFELWDRLIADAGTVYLEPTGNESEQIKHLRHLGRAWFRSGRAENGRPILARLEERATRVRQDQQAAVDKAEVEARMAAKDQKGVDDAKKAAERKFADSLRQMDRAIDELTGLNLLALDQPGPALERLKKAGDEDIALLAKLEQRTGDTAAAEKRLKEWVKSRTNETLPLAAWAEFLWTTGRKEEARTAFEDLRKCSSQLDLAMPPFARLEPIAREAGLGDDWRLAAVPTTDTGNRPPLDSLGPATWSPPMAISWDLPDSEGTTHRLSDRTGKPTIVIFYLGYGCLHCVEQLTKFAPRAKDFQAEGIDLIAISSDSPANLRKAEERYQDGKFPFQLVSDASLATFKAYRCYDDFEQQPLHGTFLIDGDGRMRWWDISYEPFMNPDFLLTESLRLLKPDRVSPIVWPKPLDDDRPTDALKPLNRPESNSTGKATSVAAGA